MISSRGFGCLGWKTQLSLTRLQIIITKILTPIGVFEALGYHFGSNTWTGWSFHHKIWHFFELCKLRLNNFRHNYCEQPKPICPWQELNILNSYDKLKNFQNSISEPTVTCHQGKLLFERTIFQHRCQMTSLKHHARLFYKTRSHASYPSSLVRYRLVMHKYDNCQIFNFGCLCPCPIIRIRRKKQWERVKPYHYSKETSELNILSIARAPLNS